VTEPIRLTIDDIEVAVEPGSTLLQAAQAAGPTVPKLCYSEHTTPKGLCRLCMVEVEGARGPQAACVTPATEGAVVRTGSEQLDRLRRTLLEMLASTVDLSASPEMLELMDRYQADPGRFADAERRQPERIDDNPVFVRDYAKCVMCWRCVQVCAEDAQYTYAIDFGGRGFGMRIATFFDQPLPQSPCVFCGQCVGACPTGALIGKREFLLEQGVPPEEVLAETRQRGAGKRSRRGPHLDGG
jgi:NADH dehydrogenase/NADH:ubiquinone oxidoreductase subunit G